MIELTGAELDAEHVGLHLAHTTLPSYAQIDGVVTRIERDPVLGGARLYSVARPFGYNIPIATYIRPAETVRLHPEPVEEVRARA